MVDEQMPKFDTKDKASFNQNLSEYMKIVEKQNLERVAKLKRIRRNNLITGCSLGVGVLGIYFYSIFSVKQESFLEDFNEPAIKPLQ